MAAISAGAALAVAAGTALGIAAERKGIVKTPGGNVLRAIGTDVSGGVYGKKLPTILNPETKSPSIPTANSNSVNQAKLKSLFDLQNRSGRASTLLTTATTDKFGG